MRKIPRTRYAYLITYDFPVRETLGKGYKWFSNSMVVKTTRAHMTGQQFKNMREFVEKDQKHPGARITNVQLIRRV